MADNSTGDVHASGSQLSITDIIVISLYFALNVAVGIWVRTCVAHWALRQNWGQQILGCLYGSYLVVCCLNTIMVDSLAVLRIQRWEGVQGLETPDSPALLSNS